MTDQGRRPDRGGTTVNRYSEKKYVCTRHGEQGPGLSFDLPERNLKKHFCMACVIDALDEFCQQLTPEGD